MKGHISKVIYNFIVPYSKNVLKIILFVFEVNGRMLVNIQLIYRFSSGCFPYKKEFENFLSCFLYMYATRNVICIKYVCVCVCVCMCVCVREREREKEREFEKHLLLTITITLVSLYKKIIAQK